MSDNITETEIITELEKAKNEIENMINTGDFSKISKYTHLLDLENEKLVEKNSLPVKEVISQVATTNVAVDLAFASVARATALKLQKLEKFLGIIEDRLFKEETIENLSNSDLLTLYQTTRIMKTDAFRMLKEIRKEIDFDKLEATLLSLHSKEELSETQNNDNANEVKSMLELLLNSKEFTEALAEKQRKNLEEIDNGNSKENNK